MRQVYPVIFTPLNDKKDTVLIEVPDWEILTEGYGMADAVKMARDAIGLKGITYEESIYLCTCMRPDGGFLPGQRLGG